MNRKKYYHPTDHERIRRFLQDVYLLNGRREPSWALDRWDYWVWHINANLYHFDLSAAIFLWQDEHERIIGVLNPDNPGEAFLQVHPGCRSAVLEIEMISTAETQYAITQPGGRHKLTIWSPAGDELRREILIRRGYVRQDWLEYQRRRPSSLPLGPAPLAAGYTMRPLGEADELPARSWLSWKAFHPDEPDEKYKGWDWYLNVQQAPLYNRDLDLVAVAPDGELAAFCTLWYDPYTAMAAFEPVGTHPDHQRRGLGKALLTEGLRRVYSLGATLATVSSYSVGAGALYASVGFTEYDIGEPWMKEW